MRPTYFASGHIRLACTALFASLGEAASQIFSPRIQSIKFQLLAVVLLGAASLCPGATYTNSVPIGYSLIANQLNNTNNNINNIANTNTIFV